jgi:hypothetical protein
MPVADEKMLEKYSNLYLEIIMRYRDYIEEEETLYVAELPTLVTPEDESVLSQVKSIRSMFAFYNYNEDFLSAAREAQYYVRDQISTVSLPIQFWLRPGQTLRLEAGDAFDKAVLLCTMLVSLGNVTSKVITKIMDSEKKFYVYCEFAGKVLLFDVESPAREFADRDAMLSELGIGRDESVTAYEFNDKMYNNLA